MNDDIRIISARTYEDFRRIVFESGWDIRNCVYVSSWNTSLHKRWQYIMGHSVLNDEQLIGYFTELERNYLIKK